MSRYTVYQGEFLCQVCKEKVKQIRVYPDTGDATWMCFNKHISKVQLYKVGYKKRK